MNVNIPFDPVWVVTNFQDGSHDNHRNKYLRKYKNCHSFASFRDIDMKFVSNELELTVEHIHNIKYAK